MKCKIKVKTSFIIAIVALIIVIKLCAQLKNLVGILYYFTYMREQKILLSILLFFCFAQYEIEIYLEYMFSLPEYSNMMYNTLTALLKCSHFHFFNGDPQTVTNLQYDIQKQ